MLFAARGSGLRNSSTGGPSSIAIVVVVVGLLLAPAWQAWFGLLVIAVAAAVAVSSSRSRTRAGRR